MEKTERERIVEAAIQYDTLTSVRSIRIAYIAGATAEHERYNGIASDIFHVQLKQERAKARNQAIQDCIERYNSLWIRRTVNGLRPNPDEVLKELESLKTKLT